MKSLRIFVSSPGDVAQERGVCGGGVAGEVGGVADRAFGFIAKTEEYGDVSKAGGIDRAKVLRTALEVASSIAGLLITTEAMVADKPAKDAPAGSGMPDMGGMGGMM